MRPSVLVVSAAALAALVTGAVVAPAVADEGVTVTVHAENAAGTPLSGIDVSLVNVDGDFVSVGTTDATGSVTGSHDQYDPEVAIEAGDWTLLTRDYEEGRFNARTQYTDGEQDVRITAEGSNDVTVLMQPGARISGTVTAPSGRPVKGILTFAQVKDEEGSYDFFGNLSPTTSKGAFTLAGLKPGTYKVTASALPDQLGNFGADTKLGPIVIQDFGQTKSGYKVKNWRVQCDTGFSVTSPKKGQAKLSIKATAKSMGLTNPKGKIVVKRGSKTVKTIPWKSAKATTVLTKQPRGKKVTYTASYSGGDCLAWKSSDKVTIKK